MLKRAETHDDLERDATNIVRHESLKDLVRHAFPTNRYNRIFKTFVSNFIRGIPRTVFSVSDLHEHDILRSHGWGAPGPPYLIHGELRDDVRRDW